MLSVLTALLLAGSEPSSYGFLTGLHPPLDGDTPQGYATNVVHHHANDSNSMNVEMLCFRMDYQHGLHDTLDDLCKPSPPTCDQHPRLGNAICEPSPLTCDQRPRLSKAICEASPRVHPSHHALAAPAKPVELSCAIAAPAEPVELSCAIAAPNLSVELSYAFAAPNLPVELSCAIAAPTMPVELSCAIAAPNLSVELSYAIAASDLSVELSCAIAAPNLPVELSCAIAAPNLPVELSYAIAAPNLSVELSYALGLPARGHYSTQHHESRSEYREGPPNQAPADHADVPTYLAKRGLRYLLQCTLCWHLYWMLAFLAPRAAHCASLSPPATRLLALPLTGYLSPLPPATRLLALPSARAFACYATPSPPATLLLGLPSAGYGSPSPATYLPALPSARYVSCAVCYPPPRLKPARPASPLPPLPLARAVPLPPLLLSTQTAPLQLLLIALAAPFQPPPLLVLVESFLPPPLLLVHAAYRMPQPLLAPAASSLPPPLLELVVSFSPPPLLAPVATSQPRLPPTRAHARAHAHTKLVWPLLLLMLSAFPPPPLLDATSPPPPSLLALAACPPPAPLPAPLPALLALSATPPTLAQAARMASTPLPLPSSPSLPPCVTPSLMPPALLKLVGSSLSTPPAQAAFSSPPTPAAAPSSPSMPPARVAPSLPPPPPTTQAVPYCSPPLLHTCAASSLSPLALPTHSFSPPSRLQHAHSPPYALQLSAQGKWCTGFAATRVPFASTSLPPPLMHPFTVHTAWLIAIPMPARGHRAPVYVLSEGLPDPSCACTFGHLPLEILTSPLRESDQNFMGHADAPVAGPEGPVLSGLLTLPPNNNYGPTTAANSNVAASALLVNLPPLTALLLAALPPTIAAMPSPLPPPAPDSSTTCSVPLTAWPTLLAAQSPPALLVSSSPPPILTLTASPLPSLLLHWSLLTSSSLQLFLLATPSLPQLLPSLLLPAVSYQLATLFLLAASSLPPSVCLLAVPPSPQLLISLAASISPPLSLPLEAAALSLLSQLAHTLSLSWMLVATLSPPALLPPLATPVLRLQLPLLVAFPLSPPLPMLATMSSLPTSLPQHTATLLLSLACALSPPAQLSACLLPSDGLVRYTYGADFIFLVAPAPASTMDPKSELANTDFEDAPSSPCGHGIPLPPGTPTKRGYFIFSGLWRDIASLLYPAQEGLCLTFPYTSSLPTRGVAIESPALPGYSRNQSTTCNTASRAALGPTNCSPTNCSSYMPEMIFIVLTSTVLAFVNTFECLKPILWGRRVLQVHKLATRYSYSLPSYFGLGIARAFVRLAISLCT